MYRRHFKHILDVLITLPVLVLVSPLLMGVAFIVRLSAGAPVFFRQQRPGLGGRTFTLYKFRTMANTRGAQGDLLSDGERLTRLGRFLRATSLDELPELLNVLRGEMSLVGPRPTSFGPETYKLWHTHRLDVIPGLTGLWQILGRAQLEFDDRLRLDIAYIERASIWLDINILARTVLAVFESRGAH